MAMQKSEELKDVVKVMNRQFDSFAVAEWGCSIMIFDKKANRIENWVAESTNSDLSCYIIEGQRHPVYKRLWKHWEQQAPTITLHHADEVKREFDNFWLYETDYKRLPDEVKSTVLNEREIFLTYSSMHHGLISVAGYKQLSEDQISILDRFSKVFEQTYTRFLDLQKAEAQAREAQIEAALERVRSSAMAMHASKDLHKVAEELRKQIGQLDYKDLETCAIHLYDESPDYFVSWAALLSPDTESDIVHSQVHFPKSGLEIFDEMMEGYNSGKKDYVIVNEGKKMAGFLKMLKQYAPGAHQVVTNTFKDFKPKDFRSFWTISDFAGGSLVMTTLTRPDVATHDLLRRFANVFGLAYRRFTDLKRAEAQAREAEIELALERVRARTMAMQSSDELREAVLVINEQLQHLGFESNA